MQIRVGYKGLDGTLVHTCLEEAMNRFLLVLVACFNFLAGCQEPPTVVVNLPAPEVTVNVQPPEVTVVITDDDDSATDDDSSVESPTPPTFTMFVLPSIGQQPVHVIDGPAEDVLMGSIAFSFEGGYQKLYSFPLNIFHRAVYDDVETQFINELGDVTGCTLQLPDGDTMELTADGNTGWWVTLPEPVIHNGEESTSVRFNLTCDIDAPTDGDPDAYAIGVNATAVIAVVDAAESMVDGSLFNNGQWVYPNSPEPSGLYPSFYTIVNPEPYPEPTLVIVHDTGCEGPQLPLPNLVTACFTATAHQADMTFSGLTLDILSSDNAASEWNTCNGPLGQEGGIWLRRQSNILQPLGTFVTSTSNGVCAPGNYADLSTAENTSAGETILDGETITFHVVMDASWAWAIGGDYLYA
ncbi:TPA: hypothetical protein DEB00_01675, partial [Candidatus Uhrbacteria bacterium]|nr:hypothetical protein [Candidatus Uhrbacteria bacterium]